MCAANEKVDLEICTSPKPGLAGEALIGVPIT